MSDPAPLKYSDALKRVERVVQMMQTCDDVDEAILMYEEAVKLVQQCQERLDQAQGRFEEIRRDVPV
tara:strand:+ start:4621 stop:4821 length:201 start_codon:yes stop_codon:yes gene_type:complete